MMTHSKIEAQWDRVRRRIRDIVGDDVYVSWLQPLQLERVDAGEVFISARNRFMRDWLTSHYLSTLEYLWRDEDPGISGVTLLVSGPASGLGPSLGPNLGPNLGNGAAGAMDDTPALSTPCALPGAPLPTGPTAGSNDALAVSTLPAASLPTTAGQMTADRVTAGPMPARAGGLAAAPRPTAGDRAAAAAPAPIAAAAASASAAVDLEIEADGEVELAAFSSPLDPRFTFNDFVTGKPNELAVAAARRIAQGEQVTFNPLFLHGGVGLGKTHLLHGIAWELRARLPGRKVLYLSAEKFMYQFIRALRFRDVMNFKELFRSVDVLLIDDVQFIADKDNTQEEFFHTFNALVDQRKQIVVSGDKSPSEMGGITERLRSRLCWGLVVDIHPTTYELRLSILQAKAEKLSIAVPPEVIDFLARKITANVRELEGALNRLVAHAELVGRRISLETAHELLRDLVRANDRVLTIEMIQKETASHFNVRLNDLLSPRRARHIARPRQVAMYLCKQLTARSLPEIGERFDKRDHTTVMHAVKRVEQLMDDDPTLREDVDRLRRKLEH